jgi:hypothetical protein
VAIVMAVPIYSAAANYDDSVSDLSNLGSAPTSLNFEVGVNSVAGRMGRPAGGTIDADVFTFTVTPGHALTSINVVRFEPLQNSFFAIASGSSIDQTSSANHLSNMLVSNTGEILTTLASGSYDGGTGLTAPLAAGTYTAWFQETAAEVNYEIAFTVAAVPEPSVYALMAIGLGLVGARAKRRK